jgi:hypothetical protein
MSQIVTVDDMMNIATKVHKRNSKFVKKWFIRVFFISVQNELNIYNLFKLCLKLKEIDLKQK